MSDWWNELNDLWKDLFAINYVYQYRCSDSMREDIITLGTNPFEGYKMTTGQEFARFDVSDKMLEQMLDLEFFYASSCSLDNVLPLVGLKNIRKLDLYVNDIRDLSCISDFENLREVYIEKNFIKSINFLEKSSHLKELFARHNLLEDVEVLAQHKHLTFVDISINGLSDISCLKGAKQLKQLQCAGNNLESLSFLAGHPEIEALECASNNIKDASFLFYLPKLEYADISDNPIEYDKYDWDKLIDNGVEVDR